MRRLLIVAALLLVLGACGWNAHKDERGFGDGPVGVIDHAPAEVYDFPQGYANWLTKCVGHGYRVYENTQIKDEAGIQWQLVKDTTCTAAPSPAP